MSPSTSSPADAPGDKDQGRTSAELSLARELLVTVLQHGQSFLARTSPPAVDGFPTEKTQLTVTELRVFGVRTYHNWTAGTMAGLGSFVLIFGGLRWRASRRLLTRVLDNQVTRPPSHFHGIEGNKMTRPSIIQNQSKSLSSSFLDDDTVAQIQFMLVGALSIVLSSAVARLASNQQQFIQDVGDLPLQPGKSRLCYTVCPAVADKLEEKTKSIYETGSDVDVNTLLIDPVTVELESMIRLIRNCRTRMDYERAHGGTADDPADVPEPGVPQRFVSLDTLGSEAHGSSIKTWFR